MATVAAESSNCTKNPELETSSQRADLGATRDWTLLLD
jgi:hypothetical protein